MIILIHLQRHTALRGLMQVWLRIIMSLILKQTVFFMFSRISTVQVTWIYAWEPVYHTHAAMIKRIIDNLCAKKSGFHKCTENPMEDAVQLY